VTRRGVTEGGDTGIADLSNWKEAAIDYAGSLAVMDFVVAVAIESRAAPSADCIERSSTAVVISVS
jgi:hypothetical protein